MGHANVASEINAHHLKTETTQEFHESMTQKWGVLVKMEQNVPKGRLNGIQYMGFGFHLSFHCTRFQGRNHLRELTV